MKIAVILNKDIREVNERKNYSAEIINKKFQLLNINSKVESVEGRYLRQQTRQVLSSGYDAVVAAGGDGTVSSVASELVDTNIPVGILPFGTLNHFAKDLNIPLDFDKAAETISGMKIQRIDTGEVNKRIFINNSSIGFYPKIVRYRKIQSEKLGLNKWLSMISAIINVFGRFPSIEVKLHSESNVVKLKTPFVFIGNNAYQIDLFNLGKRTRLNKGKLYIYFPDTKGKISMLKFAALALINQLKQAEDFVIDSSEDILLETKKKYLDVSVDGEVVKLKTPLHYKIKPRSLNVIVP